MLARSKFDIIELTISKELIDNEISHEEFTTIINEERNYSELKKSIRMMKSQRNNINEATIKNQKQKNKESALTKLLNKMKELIMI